MHHRTAARKNVRDGPPEEPHSSVPPSNHTASRKTPVATHALLTHRNSSSGGWRRRRRPEEEAEPGADDERRTRDVHEETLGLDDTLQSLFGFGCMCGLVGFGGMGWLGCGSFVT